MLEQYPTAESLAELRDNPQLSLPVPEPPKLWIADLSLRDPVCKMAWERWLAKTGICDWLPEDIKPIQELAMYNRFINLCGEAAFVREAFGESEEKHFQDKCKKEGEIIVKTERQQQLRTPGLVPQMPSPFEVQVVEPVLPVATVAVAPACSQSGADGGAARRPDRGDSSSGCGSESPDRKKRRTASAELPPHLQAQADRMADLSTLEVDQYHEQLDEWLQAEQAAVDAAVSAHEKQLSLEDKFTPKLGFFCHGCFWTNKATQVELSLVETHGVMHLCETCGANLSDEAVRELAEAMCPFPPVARDALDS